jgi:aldehyde dehydrogenase (NAD+)
MEKLFQALKIDVNNAGAYSGYGWQQLCSTTSLWPSYNPTTGMVLANISAPTQDDYQMLMERLGNAYDTWRTTPAPCRGNIIREIGEQLRQHKEVLGYLIALEMGKSKQEGEGEVQEMIDMADFAVGQSRMLYGKTMHSERPLHRMYEQWHPLGIVGIITAFNFPMAVWAWNAFIAAICGNVVLWKPSNKAPLCAIALHKLCADVLKKNHAPDIFALILSDTYDIVDMMTDDTRMPLLSFTGSTAVGKKIASRVASRLGRSILELGGNNAVIIDKTANLKLAIPSIVFGALGTSGQRCTSTRRVFVHESLYQDVIAQLKHAYAQVKPGNPLDEESLMGPLIDQDAVNRYKHALVRVQQEGGSILFGGRVLKERAGYFVEPTLVCGLKNDSPLVQEETFAPILYVMSYRTLEEAVSYQNAVSQGLSSALFTSSLQHAEYYLGTEGSDCGIANINIGTSGAEIGGAFGGEKDTGGGRESGSDAWKAYMRRQTNTINWGDALPLAQGIKFDLV